jgi:hypothetical protein
MSLYQRVLPSRILATGVPRGISQPFGNLFLKWIECNGEEWAVSRLKAVKLDVIRSFAGLQPVGSWIKRGKHEIFSGSLGSLVSWMRKHPKNFKKGIQLLQVYTLCFAKEETPSQINKFVSAVKAPPPDRGAVDSALQLVFKGLSVSKIHSRLRPLPMAKRLIDMVPSSSRRAPTLLWGSLKEEAGIIDSCSYLNESIMGWRHYQEFAPFYDAVFDTLKPLIMDATGRNHPLGWSPIRPAGKIGLIQEPGYKLRAVANPGRVFQRVLEPLGSRIYSLLRSLPWDCTFDQSKAIPAIQSALASGRQVHSIDLSNATDYFPLSLQIPLLRKLFGEAPNGTCGKSVVDLFEALSQSDWQMGESWIRWNRGQPLGLFPSFGSFALTHGLLLLGIAQKWDNQFFVLGDDVVILDTRIKEEYMDTLALLGCPISEPKSLSSSSLAEFAGKVITDSSVISQYKWRNVSDDSFIDIARNIGPSSMALFRKRQRRVIKELSEVPEFLGGLGWNPEGKPLGDRLKPWIFDDDYKGHTRVTGLSRMHRRQLMTSNLVQTVMDERRKTNLPIVYPSPPDDIDQMSLDLLNDKIPGFAAWVRIMGKNLDVVFHSLDQELDLPIESECGSANSSMLLRWERVLTPDHH